MSRQTFVLRDGKLVEKHKARPISVAPAVVSDIEEYRAVATADRPVIGSRSQHREYLRRHNLVEYGNDLPPSAFNNIREE